MLNITAQQIENNFTNDKYGEVISWYMPFEVSSPINIATQNKKVVLWRDQRPS